MSERHIRDVMMGTLSSVSNHAMCGDNGPKIEFAIPGFSTCTRCKDRWEEEKIKDRVRHKFRLKMHGVLNLGGDLDNL